MKKILCLAAGLLALASIPAIAADDYNTTAGGVTRTFRAKDVGSGKLAPMSIPTDVTGVPYGIGNGLYVRQDGSWTFGLSGPIPAGSNVIGGVTNPSLGTPSDTAWDGNAASASIVAILKGLPRSAGSGGGAASSVTLLGGSANVGNVGIVGTVPVSGTFFQATQPVSAASLPLPTGAATAAAQTTLQTTAASIDTKTPALVNGAVPADTIVRTTSVNRGGTLTTANTAVTLVPSNANRRGLAIQNRNAPGSSYNATTSVFMSCLATATADFNSLEIPAGALYETPAHHSGTGACSFISATASTPVYVREF